MKVTIAGVELLLINEMAQVINDELELTFNTDVSIDALEKVFLDKNNLYSIKVEGEDETQVYLNYVVMTSLEKKKMLDGTYYYKVALAKEELVDQLNVTQLNYALSVLVTSFTDGQAINCVELFEEWKPDTKYIVGDRKRVGNILYKCKQNHTSQSIYPPNLIPAIWDIVGNEEQGTKDNPVIVPDEFSSMVYVKGKYYLDKDVLYLMNRQGMKDGEEISLTHRPSQLVGHYFEVVEGGE